MFDQSAAGLAENKKAVGGLVDGEMDGWMDGPEKWLCMWMDGRSFTRFINVK